jgi:hypothetical protein
MTRNEASSYRHTAATFLLSCSTGARLANRVLISIQPNALASSNANSYTGMNTQAKKYGGVASET